MRLSYLFFFWALLTLVVAVNKPKQRRSKRLSSNSWSDAAKRQSSRSIQNTVFEWNLVWTTTTAMPTTRPTSFKFWLPSSPQQIHTLWTNWYNDSNYDSTDIVVNILLTITLPSRQHIWSQTLSRKHRNRYKYSLSDENNLSVLRSLINAVVYLFRIDRWTSIYVILISDEVNFILVLLTLVNSSKISIIVFCWEGIKEIFQVFFVKATILKVLFPRQLKLISCINKIYHFS